MLKKLSVALLSLSLLLTLARPAEATANMIRSDLTSAWVSTGISNAYPTSSCDSIKVQVFSSAGSTATVVIEQSSSSSGPWFPSATISNPSAVGEYWSLTRTNYVRVNVSAWTSGTISANIEGYNGKDRVI